MAVEYRHSLVQAIADFWEAWQPKMEEGINAMPPIQRLFFRQIASYLDISMVLNMLDNSPETVELIREKLAKVIEAEELDAINDPATYEFEQKEPTEQVAEPEPETTEPEPEEIKASIEWEEEKPVEEIKEAVKKAPPKQERPKRKHKGKRKAYD